jgi:5-hydroxyisourate hydrolase-like protein (transthyretin family)
MINKRFVMFPVVLLLSAVCLVPAALAQGGIKGKVRNNKGGVIAGATVTARLSGTDVKTVRSDSKGTFTMEGLDAGTYNVVFDADGYATGVKFGVEIKNGSVRDLGDRLILSVDQGSQLIVKGSVFYREGTSVAGAKVQIERVNDDGTTKNLGTAYTNLSGEFTFRPPLGTNKIRVTAKFRGVSGAKEIDEMVNAGIYRTAIKLELSQGEKN